MNNDPSLKFFFSHPDPMWIYELETLRILETNTAAVVRYGWSREEFLAMTLADLHPPEELEALRQNVSAVSSGLDVAGIWRHRLKSGEVREVDIISHTLEYDGRACELVVGRDVTRLMELEREKSALLAREQQASELLRIAGHAAMLGGWRVELDPPRVEWTAETAAIHEEPDGTSPTLERAFGYYVPEHRERIRQAFEACAQSGLPFNQTLQIVTAHGRRRWVRAMGEAEYDAGGRVRAVRGAFQDVTDLVEARRRSEELADRLRDTLESISDAFFTLDRDWNFSFVNTEAQRLLRRKAHQLVGLNVWAEFPEAVGTPFQREYERVRRERRSVSFVEYFGPLQTLFQVTAYPTPDDGVAVYFRDITAETEREQRLRLLETAVARQNDMLLITEADLIDAPHGPKIVYVNDAFVRHTGYAPAEVIGRTPRLLQGPGTDRDRLDRVREALEHGLPVRTELLNYTRSGEPLWVELDIAPITDGDGRFTHWVAVLRDIGERKRAERELELSQERFELVSRATNDIVWDWDMQTGTIWYNDSMQAALGWSPEALQGGLDSWSERLHPEDRERVLASLHAAVDGAADTWNEEYRFRRANGEYAVIMDRAIVRRDAQGRATRAVGSMLDVTELRDLDERLRQSQKLEAVGQLTGGVAHDFNNLLTVIMGNAELLTEQLADAPAQQALANTVLESAERGAALVSRLLAFARRQPLQPQPVDLNQLLAGMDPLLRRTLSESIDIELVRGGGLWQAQVDGGQLEAAVLNLAINARDAMPDGGCLTLETANVWLDEAYSAAHDAVPPGQYVLLSVSDTGAGMPASVAERAFDPFFTTKEPGKGTGLGLSMVYGFVKQSGGHAKIYTELGEGTTVRLYLPRASAGQPESAQGGGATATGGREHVLVVEDDELVRGHLMAQLRGLGYRVSGAGDGREALGALERLDDVDLLLTDVVMPGGMNGRELANETLRRWPHLKVLYTSGYTENAIVHHGRLDAGVALLSKPYRRHELAAKVRRVLDG